VRSGGVGKEELLARHEAAGVLLSEAARTPRTLIADACRDRSNSRGDVAMP